MLLELFNNLIPENAELILFPRKPVAKNHPWKQSIKGWQTKKINDLTNERNMRWLNDFKKDEYETVMWTKEMYSIDKLEEYGYKVDSDDDKTYLQKFYKYNYN